MLKEQNDEQLKQKGLHELIIPFYQIWQEMVNEKTLDIYQYRILTSLSALDELAEVLKKTLSGVFTNDANVESCVKETLYIIKSDLIMDKYYKSLLNRLKHNLGLSTKTDSEKNRLYAQVRYAFNNIVDTYDTYAIAELKENILNSNIEGVEFCCNVVVSQAVHKGWSAQALNDLLRFFREKKAFEYQWEAFQEKLLNQEKIKYCVLIHIPFKNIRSSENNSVYEILKNFNLDIYCYEELVRDLSEIEDIGSLLNANKRYFSISVYAYDVFSAAHIAIRQISELLNMASFFNLVSAWDLSSVSIVSINTVNKYHKAFNAERLYKTHDYLDSSGKIFEDTKKIFTDDTQKVLREKLRGSFGYTNISRASLFQEEKFMNLWVALESLARTRMYPDIISCVKQTVPAAMSLRYIYRIVRNYIEDCMRCNVEFNFTNYCVDMKQETKQKMVKETIEVFNQPELYEQLILKTKVNSLLQYRTNKIYEILNDTKILKEKIQNHHDRVEWQIQRLYRMRNEIVHSALQNDTSLITLIEHLYEYLSIYITEIVTCISMGKDRTIEESLTIIKDNYEVFVSLLKEKEDILIKETVMKTGVINLISDKK